MLFAYRPDKLIFLFDSSWIDICRSVVDGGAWRPIRLSGVAAIRHEEWMLIFVLMQGKRLYGAGSAPACRGILTGINRHRPVATSGSCPAPRSDSTGGGDKARNDCCEM